MGSKRGRKTGVCFTQSETKWQIFFSLSLHKKGLIFANVNRGAKSATAYDVKNENHTFAPDIPTENET